MPSPTSYIKSSVWPSNPVVFTIDSSKAPVAPGSEKVPPRSAAASKRSLRSNIISAQTVSELSAPATACASIINVKVASSDPHKSPGRPTVYKKSIVWSASPEVLTIDPDKEPVAAGSENTPSTSAPDSTRSLKSNSTPSHIVSVLSVPAFGDGIELTVTVFTVVQSLSSVIVTS